MPTVQAHYNALLAARETARMALTMIDSGSGGPRDACELCMEIAIPILNGASAAEHERELAKAATDERMAGDPLAFGASGYRMAQAQWGLCYQTHGAGDRAQTLLSTSEPQIRAALLAEIAVREARFESYRRAVACGVAVAPEGGA